MQLFPIVGLEFIGGLAQAGLAGSKVKLFANNVTLSVTTVKSDLTEATFTGYTAQTVTATNDPYIDTQNGGVSVGLPSHQFEPASPYTVQNTIYGWWVEDSTGALVAVGKFDTPMPAGALGDAIPLQITLNF